MDPMLSRVQVKNYRSLADVDVYLEPITALVGQNGSGKSTFLDVVGFVSDAMAFGLRGALNQRGGIDAIRRWSPRGEYHDVEITLTVDASDVWAQYGFSLASDGRNAYRVQREFCRYGSEQREATLCFELVNGEFSTHMDPDGNAVADSPVFDTGFLALPALGSFGNKTLAALQAYFANMKRYALNPDLIRSVQPIAHEYELAEHGGNSASLLNRMIEDEAPVLSELRAALTHVVNDIRDIRVQRAGRHLVTEFQHEFPHELFAWFDAAQESDGTLRLLGLLLAAYQPPPNVFLAIEEPELALHPGAMGLLSDILLSLEGRTQLLLTTQSPDLVARFSADQIRVVEKINGQTEIGRLHEAQRDVINQNLFSGGDLLRIEGLYREESRAR